MIVRQVKRIIQSLCLLLLFLAFGPLWLLRPVIQDPLFRDWVPVIPLLCAFGAGWEFVRRALGVTAKLETEDVGLMVRRAFLVPTVAAAAVGLVMTLLLQFWDHPFAEHFALWIWLLPFALAWLYLRHLSRPLVLRSIQFPHLWRRAFGPPAVILVVVVFVFLVGYCVAFILQQDALLWSAIGAILFLQALVVIQFQQLADAAARSSSGTTPPVERPSSETACR
jgi:hypothetical protein